MMNAMTVGSVYGGASGWQQKDILAHIAFMKSWTKSLGESGGLASTEGLALPDQARIVRAGRDGAPITDGVFPETEESWPVTGLPMWKVRSEPIRSPPGRRRRRVPAEPR